MSISFDGSFYDADYYERGKQSGKGWLENYRWMPLRSIREALGFIDHLGLDESSKVLDFGCAKGFLVKAFRMLDIKADGCDISGYALLHAPEGCFNSSRPGSLSGREYTHVVSKDVFEHLTESQLIDTLRQLRNITSTICCVVPLGDDGKYRIQEYHTEISHILCNNESWWYDVFKSEGFDILSMKHHIAGIKDNWVSNHPEGNAVFTLVRSEVLQ